MKLLREKLYDKTVNHYIEFIGSDALNYNGYCLEWLEDGSLVMYDVNVFEERESEHPIDGWNCEEDVGIWYCTRPVNHLSDTFQIVNGDFIRLFSCKEIPESDKLTDEHQAKQEAYFERLNKRGQEN